MYYVTMKKIFARFKIEFENSDEFNRVVENDMVEKQKHIINANCRMGFS